ncbi:MAG: hypothetical protein AAGE59_29915 [Cyanobacteria bacterium P01_F01_bin.86]
MHSSFQTLLELVREAETLEEARNRLGEILELAGPAPAAVTLRVLIDSVFAEKLITVRKFPDWRDRLLADPSNAAFEPTGELLDESEKNTSSITSVVALVKKSSASLLRWGAAGFRKAEPAVIERRKAACLSCDQLVASPNSFPYQIAKAFAGNDRRICAACGCVVAKKILMSTETCPLTAPGDPNHSRWGEPTAQSDRA